MKAKLTGGQVVAAVFAGILGHLLFCGGWVLLGLVLFGGLLTGLLGITAAGIAGVIAEDNPAVSDLFTSAGGIVGGALLVAAVIALVLMLAGFLVSGWILSGGRVRKPWGTTFWSIVIVAVLCVPLLLVYLAISGRGEGGLPFPLVATLGTLISGVLVWLWMTWAHRGPAAPAAASTAAPVESAPAAAEVEAPSSADPPAVDSPDPDAKP